MARLPQQRLSDGLLHVLLQQLPDIPGLRQELLLQLQPRLLCVRLQPAGLLQDTCLLEDKHCESAACPGMRATGAGGGSFWAGQVPGRRGFCACSLAPSRGSH